MWQCQEVASGLYEGSQRGHLITVFKYKEKVSDNRRLINLADSGRSEIHCLEAE